MRSLLQVISLQRRKLVFLLSLAAVGVACAENYRIPFGSDPNSTNPEACVAAGAKWYPSTAAACQGATISLPLCDRKNAIYRGYVAQLTSANRCYVQWEFLNNGATDWGSWSGTYDFAVQRVVDVYRDAKPPPSNTCRPKAGNPIYPLTGNKQEVVATSLVVGGQLLNLTYSSARALVANAAGVSANELGDLPALGSLWLSSLHRKLLITNQVFGAKLFRGDGTVVQFRIQSGAWVADGDVTGQLTNIGGVYRYVDAVNKVVETYNGSGQLIGLVDMVGNSLTYTYSLGASVTAPAAGYLIGVRDNAGRNIRFEYLLPAGGVAAFDGRVSRIIDPTGQAITTGYDASGNLISLTWSDGKVRQFLYENSTFPWALTGVVDEGNNRYATFTYDSAGLAISTGYAGGVNQYSVNYVTPPAVVITENYDSANDILYRYHDWQAPSGITLTTPSGYSAELSATTILGEAVLTGMSQPAGSGCSAGNSSSAYDANGNPQFKDDFQGNRICYAYDSSNRETVRVEGLATSVACSTVTASNATLPTGARKITTVWHPDWRLPVQVNEPTRRTTTVYQGQPDPFNNNASANCRSAANLPNGKPMPVVCKQVEQALLEASGGNPITWDLSYDKVSLLLHADGVNGSKSFVDSSSSPKTATVSGNTAISTVQSKFGSASAYFDGTSSSYLSFPAASTIVGTGDLTIEGWIYPTATTQGTVYSNFNSASAGHSLLYFVNTQLQWYYAGNSNFSSPANSAPLNQWTNFALVRSGTTCTIYINGVSAASTACASAIGTTATDFRLGNAQWSSIPFKGFLDDVRVTLGQSRYAANYTPSSTAFGGSSIDTSVAAKVRTFTYDAGGRVLTSTDENNRTTSYNYYGDSAFSISSQGLYDVDYDTVSLLLHADGTNNSTSVFDSSATSKEVSVAGNAKISTAQSKFGGSSMSFDGTGDYLLAPNSQDFHFDGGDFTVESWVYATNRPTAAGQFDFIVSRDNIGVARGWSLALIESTAYLSFALWTSNSAYVGVTDTMAFPLNQWVHVAVTRSGNTLRLFRDGVLVATNASAIGAGQDTNTALVIGSNRSSGSVEVTGAWNFNGHIDDLRITKGVARYVANFTLPTTEFPNHGPLPMPADIGHAVGDLERITNPAGHVTQYTQYDRAGRVRQMIDAKGVVTDITYTTRGWVSTVTATAPGGAGRTTSYTYDGVGQLTGVVQPDGTTLSYNYDAAHRLVGVTDAKGNSVNYTLDNVGNRIAEEVKDPTGVLQRSISRSYDALNRLQQVTGAAQ